MQTNNVFSFRRFIAMIRHSVIVHQKQIGIALTGFAGGMVIILFLFQNLGGFDRWTGNDYVNTFLILFFVLGILYTGSSFPAFRSKQRSIQYLTLPVTNLERFVFEFFSRFILFLIVFPLLFWLIANAEGNLAHKLFPDLADHSFSLAQVKDYILKGKAVSSDTMFQFRISQYALFIFFIPFTGSVFFKKFPLLKTIFSVVLIAAGFTILIFSLIWILHLKDYQPNERILFFYTEDQLLAFSTFFLLAVNIALLFISWFRLKEREAQ